MDTGRPAFWDAPPEDHSRTRPDRSERAPKGGATLCTAATRLGT